jgi:O-antigen ligase
MTSDNPVADRLLSDARKKTARLENPALAKAALIVGVVAVLASPVSIAGWILGAIAIGLGVPGIQRPVSAKRAKIAVALGVAAILIGVFFFTWNIAQR